MDGLVFKPVTSSEWSDLEKLFGPRGACAGCWCMCWRLPRKQFEAGKGDPNKWELHRLIDNGEVPGILAYSNGEPAGWCAVAPRPVYPFLANSRILKPVDDQPVWSVSCLFVAKAFRRKGLTVELLKAAIEQVRQAGGKVVEGYPVEVKNPKTPDTFAWTGIASAFLKAGFQEVLRRSETRPIMRYYL